MAEVDAGNVFLLAVLLLFSIIKMYSRRRLSPPEVIASGGLFFVCSNSILIHIFSVGMRLLLIICHLIAFDHRIILLRRYRLRQGFIQ